MSIMENVITEHLFGGCEIKNERRMKMKTEKFLQLGTGEEISRAECKKLKDEFCADVLNHWNEFEQSLTDEQRKQIIA